MKRMMVMMPNDKDGTSWYRAAGPLGAMRDAAAKRGVLIEPGPRYTKEMQFHWADLSWCDVLFFQRPAGEGSLRVLTDAKQLGKKIWLDYDDNLICVPMSNPAYDTYVSVEAKRTLSKILHLADVVTASTKHLADTYAPINKNIHVVPNGFCDYQFSLRKTEKPRSRLIAWRGSETHREDLDTYLQAMKVVAECQCDWQWLFVASKPYYAIHNTLPAKRLLSVGAFPLPKYFHWLNSLNAEIGIVPLKDNSFNRSKSNIAWQEFTYAGSAVLAPDWDEWRLPGVTNYQDENDFQLKLRALINDEAQRREKVALSAAELQKNWLQSKMNEKRLAILENLLYGENSRPPFGLPD